MVDPQAPDALAGLKLRREVDFERDNTRGGSDDDAVSLVVYGDYLCPYCREVRFVLAELRKTLGKRAVYVFRQFPDERTHPGAQFLASAAIAAGRQDRFWPMHDWIYAQDLPIANEQVFAFAASIGLDEDRFRTDLESDPTRERIDEDVAEGIANGVTRVTLVEGAPEEDPFLRQYPEYAAHEEHWGAFSSLHSEDEHNTDQGSHTTNEAIAKVAEVAEAPESNGEPGSQEANEAFFETVAPQSNTPQPSVVVIIENARTSLQSPDPGRSHLLAVGSFCI